MDILEFIPVIVLIVLQIAVFFFLAYPVWLLFNAIVDGPKERYKLFDGKPTKKEDEGPKKDAGYQK